MKKENFDKGIQELRSLKLTVAEKEAMLENVLKTPIASPYGARVGVYAYVHRFSAVIALCLIVVLTSGTLAFASERSLPGEKLYSIKVKVLEPLRGALAVTPNEELEWEGEKVVRRLVEAEKLADEDKLEEGEIEKLEQEIEKSSSAFAKKAGEISLSTATTTNGRKLKEADLRQSFKEKLDSRDRDEDEDESDKKNEEGREKVKRLKDRAVEALEKDRGDGNK